MREEKYTDGNKRTYDHIILNDKEMVLCFDEKNTEFKGEVHIIKRSGESLFGNQILIEFLMQSKGNVYPAKKSRNGFDFVEIYLKSEEAIELFKRAISLIEGSKSFGYKEWKKDLCERCGEHNYCLKCKKYTWSKEDGNKTT